MLVHLIDDHEAARDSAAFLLTADRLHMPEISGLELLRRLKNQRLQWPVIVITGSGELSAAIETLKEGARSLIEKPFDDEDFLSEVRSASWMARTFPIRITWRSSKII